jgi:hypothetical protein
LVLRAKARPVLGKLFKASLVNAVPFGRFLFKRTGLMSEFILTAIVKAENPIIRLNAVEAERFGNLEYEPEIVYENIGYWNSTADYVEWSLNVPEPKSFTIFIEQACRKGYGGDYFVSIGPHKIDAKVVDTGGWMFFSRCQIGTFSISKAGEYTLRVQAANIQNGALMNLRSVILQPSGF